MFFGFKKESYLVPTLFFSNKESAKIQFSNFLAETLS